MLLYISDEGAENLAVAIVEQAVRDWYRARQAAKRRDEKLRLENGARLLAPRTHAPQVERFLKSRWFRCLMDMDGEELLDAMRRTPLRDARGFKKQARLSPDRGLANTQDKVGTKDGRRKKRRGPSAPDG